MNRTRQQRRHFAELMANSETTVDAKVRTIRREINSTLMRESAAIRSCENQARTMGLSREETLELMVVNLAELYEEMVDRYLEGVNLSSHPILEVRL